MSDGGENLSTRSVADLTAELAAYRAAFGPLVVGAQPVRCLTCMRQNAELTEANSKLAQVRALAGDWARTEAKADSSIARLEMANRRICGLMLLGLFDV